MIVKALTSTMIMLMIVSSALAQNDKGWDVSMIDNNWVLTISSDFSENYPWKTSSYDKVVVTDNVTILGDGFINEWEDPKPLIYNGTIADWSKMNIQSKIYCSSLTIDNKIISGDIALPDNVTEIGDYCFNIEGITSVTIPTSVTKIGAQAFYQGVRLDYIGDISEYMSIDMSKDRICESFSLFCEGTELTELTIPDGTEVFTGYNFSNCLSIKDIYIPKSVKSFKNTFIENPNHDNRNIYYSGNVEDWCSIKFGGDEHASYNGCAIFQEYYDLYIGGKKVVDLVIPSSVESVPDGAFYGANIKTITIEEGVKNIEVGAFWKCENLSVINIPHSIEHIKTYGAMPGFLYGSCTNTNSLRINYNGSSNDWIQMSINSSLISSGYWRPSENNIEIEMYVKGEKLTELIIDDSTPTPPLFCGSFSRVKSIEKTVSKLQTPVVYHKALIETSDVYIPYGTTSIYQETWGTQFNYIEMEPETTIHKVSLFTENSGIHFGNYVSDGSSFSTLVEVQDGYKISGITVNGTDAMTELNTNNVLTIKDITENKTIIVSFEVANVTGNKTITNNDFRAWKNNGELFIEVPTNAVKLEVYDTAGRMVETQKCNGYCIKTLKVGQNIHIVKMLMNDGTMATRKM